MLHFGTHGSLEFMPGKQVGMSDLCYPDSLISSIPNIYYYAANNPSEATIAKRRSYANTISYLTPPAENAGLYKGLKVGFCLCESVLVPGTLRQVIVPFWRWCCCEHECSRNSGVDKAAGNCCQVWYIVWCMYGLDFAPGGSSSFCIQIRTLQYVVIIFTLLKQSGCVVIAVRFV